MELSPFKVLKEAIKAVPAVRYALGIAGIVSVIAIVKIFKIRFEVAVFGTIIIIALMFLLLIFSSLAEQKSKKTLRLQAKIFSWIVLVIVIFIIIILTVDYFTHWPFNIFKSEPITLVGTVQDENGNPIVGAEITDDNSEKFVRTGGDGGFVMKFPEVRRGDVISLLVYHDDYIPNPIKINVKDKEEERTVVLKAR